MRAALRRGAYGWFYTCAPCKAMASIPPVPTIDKYPPWFACPPLPCVSRQSRCQGPAVRLEFRRRSCVGSGASHDRERRVVRLLEIKLSDGEQLELGDPGRRPRQSRLHDDDFEVGPERAETPLDPVERLQVGPHRHELAARPQLRLHRAAAVKHLGDPAVAVRHCRDLCGTTRAKSAWERHAESPRRNFHQRLWRVSGVITKSTFWIDAPPSCHGGVECPPSPRRLDFGSSYPISSPSLAPALAAGRSVTAGNSRTVSGKPGRRSSPECDPRPRKAGSAESSRAAYRLASRYRFARALESAATMPVDPSFDDLLARHD